MSNDSEKSRKSIWAYLKQNPIVPVLGSLVAVVGLLFHMTVSSKDAKIELLEAQLNECEKEHRSLEAERDSFDFAAKGDSAVICPGDMETFFDETITITLVRARKAGETWEHSAEFLIVDVVTEQEWAFTAGRERSFKFWIGENEYVLHFSGFKMEGAENCARIRVTEMKPIPIGIEEER